MNRKAALREYRETRRPMGAYQVRNVVDGKVLVGVSVDLPAILNRNRTALRFGGHPNRALQADWNALGPDAFAFEVLDTLAPPEDRAYDPAEDLRTLEALWLDALKPFGERGYNPRRERSA